MSHSFERKSSYDADCGRQVFLNIIAHIIEVIQKQQFYEYDRIEHQITSFAPGFTPKKSGVVMTDIASDVKFIKYIQKLLHEKLVSLWANEKGLGKY